MSAKGHTFLEISTYLMQNLEGIKMVDKDKGQLDDISNFVIPMPAIFISFGRFEYENQASNIQKGTGPIRFRIAVQNYADSYTGSVNQDKALEFFDFNEKVHQALQGLSGTYFGSLVRIVDEDDIEHKNVIVTVFEYETTIVDDSAFESKEFILVDPDPALDVQHKKTLPEQGVGESRFVTD